MGEFENSESPYGTFDQGGNVWEWNENGRDEFVAWFAWRVVPHQLEQLGRVRPVRQPRPDGRGPRRRFSRGIPEPGSVVMLLGFAWVTLLYYWRQHA